MIQKGSWRDRVLFSLAINTAVAIAKDFAKYGLPAALGPAAADVAMGAVQTAVVLTCPLPHPAEWAEVAERGPELVGQPGKSYRLEIKPTITCLSAGDRVYTATETHRILATAQLDNQLIERASYR